MKILVTGGAGYIGSVTNWLLKQQGYETVVFDNMENGHRQAVGDTMVIVGDLRNPADIERAMASDTFDAVIHFAALALAGESMQIPREYFHNNIDGGLNLLEAMRKNGVRNIIFSSTCAVYGFPKTLPVVEDMPIAPVSVYGASKRMFEEVLGWYDTVFGIKSAQLRYFNACGALPDGTLGEDHPVETHIIPVAIRAAMKDRPVFDMFGTDYKTPDGTCVRDYIHVLDLADAHIRAAKYLTGNAESFAVNLGVGKGYSNRQIVSAIEKATGKMFEVKEKPRRWGDPDSIWADNSKAKEKLGWTPKYTDIDEIIKTAWTWHSTHPEGYGPAE